MATIHSWYIASSFSRILTNDLSLHLVPILFLLPNISPLLFQSDSESKDEDSSPERPARRGVTFRDTVETFPVSGRMDRLRRLLYDEAEEQRKQHTKVMRQTYRDQLKEIQQEQEREKALQQKRKMVVSTIHLI